MKMEHQMSDRYADEKFVVHAHLLLALAALRKREYKQNM